MTRRRSSSDCSSIGPSSQMPALLTSTSSGRAASRSASACRWRGVGDVAGDRLDPLTALAGQVVEPVSAAGGGQHVRAACVQDSGEPRAQAR